MAVRLTEAVATSPGLSFGALVKQYPSLSGLRYLGHSQGVHIGPLRILRQHPHLVSVRSISDGTKKWNGIFPAEFDEKPPPIPTFPLANPGPPTPAVTGDGSSCDTSIPGPIVRHATIIEPIQAPVVRTNPPMTTHSATSKTRLVQTIADCTDASKVLLAKKILAVDCEGVKLSASGRLCLVQVACSMDDDDDDEPEEYLAYLFDFVTGTEVNREKAALLKVLFEDASKIKIFHDSRRDAEALYHQLGISLKNVCDTQVYYALIKEMQHLLRIGESEEFLRVGLNQLLSDVKLQLNQQKSQIKALMEKNPRFWEQRPLTPAMMEYAAADVRMLIPLRKRLEELLQTRLQDNVALLSLVHAGTHLPTSLSLANDKLLGLTYGLSFDDTHHPIYSVNLLEEDQQSVMLPFIPKDDIELLLFLRALPPAIRGVLKPLLEAEAARFVVEVVIDDGRVPYARFSDNTICYLHSGPIAIKEALRELPASSKFSDDNRAGIEGTLHRVSAIRDREGEIIGLTYRIGRHVMGAAELMRDLVSRINSPTAGNRSVLLLGRPGVGKTTLLREIARVLADVMMKAVVIVDTSSEIGGLGSRPHEAIGRARRMPVSKRVRQHEILVEAVQNHTPEVLVIDEIGTAAEVEAVRTIAQRGVGMVATAHGDSLHSLMKNPTLRPLIGGIHPVTLGDSAAKSRAIHTASASPTAKKTMLERQGAPTFDVVVEIREKKRWIVYNDVAKTVDNMLGGGTVMYDERWQTPKGSMFVRRQAERRRESSAHWVTALTAAHTSDSQ